MRHFRIFIQLFHLNFLWKLIWYIYILIQLSTADEGMDTMKSTESAHYSHSVQYKINYIMKI